MKIRELLRESEQDQLAQDLQDLLARLKGSGKNSIDTESVVSQLARMGHTVTPETIMQLVAEVPMHVVADQQTISVDTTNINNDSGSGSDDTTDDSAQKVSRMAKKAADKEL